MRLPLKLSVAPLAVLILVTLSLSGCSAPNSIRSDSSPSFAAVEAALAQTGVDFCNMSYSQGGSFCDRHAGQPSVAMVVTDIPEEFFTSAVSLAKIPDNSVWINGGTIVGVNNPSRAVVTALDQNGFKWLTTGQVTFHPGNSSGR